MALGNEELFRATLDSMDPGDTLMIMGGVFPGPESRAEIDLGMQVIYPMLLHVTGSYDRYPEKTNPLAEVEDPITLTLERNNNRFSHDPGVFLGIGKKAGLILDLTVDLITVGFNDFYFVGKTSLE